MTTETLIILNLMFYLIGFAVLFGIKPSILGEFSGWISLVINILGIIFSFNLNTLVYEDYLIHFNWIDIGSTKFNYGFLVNNQTIFMYGLVQTIGVFVQLFSIKYLKNDPRISKYFGFLNLFLFSMLGLVVSSNLLQMFIFWELVGFCSFLLIGFWYHKKSANDAARKAFIVNRIGDVFFLVGIMMLYLLTNTLEFFEITEALQYKNMPGFDFMSLNAQRDLCVFFIFGGVVAKSAQFPLQIWLPDAMQGPTPASALIHAATMVVAGIFLLGRISPIITPDAGFVIALTGAITSVIGGFSAIFQNDIKKVLAYSTISQLGMMVAGMGIGSVGATFFHLTTHAFFKAGLFLCAGAVIDYFHHEQDMRKMGNLIRKTPAIFYGYLICAASIIGMPFTSGYLSKESLLNAFVAYGWSENVVTYRIIIPILIGISAFFTAFYMIRQLVMVFFERQENPVEKMIDSTKRTMEGVYKTFQDLLNADEDNTKEGSTLLFLQNLSVFEVSILSLSFASLWLLFSPSPFSYHESWFLENFKHQTIEFNWIPISAFGIFLTALLISYNTTSSEIRSYYLGEKPAGAKRSFYLLGYHNFYIDKFLSKTFERVILGKPIAQISRLIETEISFYYLKGLGNLIHSFEKKGIDVVVTKLSNGLLQFSKFSLLIEQTIIDNTVLKVSSGIKNIGDKLRRVQEGKMQLYILSMVIILVTIMLLKIFIF